MSMSSTLQKRAVRHISKLISQTMEEEIFDLDSLIPDLTQRLQKMFADSVVDSFNSILGEATAEALIRRIGEDNLQVPTKVYESLDEFLQGGSDVLKGAILEEFRVKVHQLFKLGMDMVRQSDGI